MRAVVPTVGKYIPVPTLMFGIGEQPVLFTMNG
jgi:hypothetical protein